MHVTVTRSGSAGNATLFASGNTRVLVDAGISPKALRQRLQALDATDEVGWLSAIVVTHAHRDHVGHAGRIAKQRGIPVYLSEATNRHVRLEGGVETRIFHPKGPFVIGAFEIAPLPLPHDAAQVALTFDDGARRVGLATDLGQVPGALPGHFARCDAILLESNHDEEMLRSGPYPDFLKRRIASARGHLSNVQTAELLRALPSAVRTVVLMHLSEKNNRPDLARACAEDALRGRDVALFVASQDDQLLVPRRAPVKTAAGGLAARTSARPVQLSLF